MSRTSPHDTAVRRTADNQAGLITSAQLAEIGLRTSTASRRSIGGMWTRVLPGVHLVDGGSPSRHQRERAALLYAGEPSMLTGMTGLRQHTVRAIRLQEVADDVPEHPEPVHVLIPHDTRRLSTGYVRVERTRRFPTDVVRRDSLPIAPLARCVGDAARRSSNASDVTALVTEVVQRGLLSVVELEQELASGSRRGSALPEGRCATSNGRERRLRPGDALTWWCSVMGPRARDDVAGGGEPEVPLTHSGAHSAETWGWVSPRCRRSGRGPGR